MAKSKGNEKFIPTLPDILSVSGVCGIGYGLHIFKPWLSYVIVGAILLFLGVFGHISSSKVSK